MIPTLLIYDADCRIYEEMISKRLPDLRICSSTIPEQAFDVIEEVKVILSWKIPDELLKRAKNLRWFASLGAGNEHLVNNVHLPEAVILTKSTAYGKMMAEYVFAYILYFIRELEKHFDDQRKRRWQRKNPRRLSQKVMGILGLGSVGKEIAKRGKQFEMYILGVRRSPGPTDCVDEIFGPKDLGQVIPRVDFLITALPLTSKTHHLLGEKELNLMKEGATLFSIGRGKTIDEAALTKILKTGKIQAVLDVFDTEPLFRESELWSLKNVIITPHVSGITAVQEVCEEFIANYQRWEKGESLSGLVDRIKGY